MSGSTEVIMIDGTGTEAEEREAFSRLRALVSKVDRETPDKAALQELRTLLDTMPILARVLCDLAQVNAEKVITSIVQGTTTVEAVRRNARTMRDDMGYKSAPELERALIDHVVLCWLRLQKVEYSYSAQMAGSLTFAQADYWERRLTTAQHRYLKACESLARVRRLGQARTALQLNIAARQVNTVAAGAPPVLEEEQG